MVDTLGTGGETSCKANFESYSLESLGNAIDRKLDVGELSNRSIGKMYYQYYTDTDDINGYGEINEIPSIYMQLVPVTQVSLGISFTFKLFFFSQKPFRGLFLEDALEVCIESAGEAPILGCNLNKLQSSFNEITLALAWVSHVGLLHIFGAHCGGLLLLFFFFFFALV